MTKYKLWTAFWVMMSFCVAPAWAGCSVSHGSESTGSGKSMEHLVGQAEKGFPNRFTESEVLDVMNASRGLKKSDRPLAIRLERIASKMAHTEKK